MLETGRTLRREKRALFVQATEPGGYPPLINASTLMADAGWEVTFLSAPVGYTSLPVPPHPRITIRKIRPRTSHVMTKRDYLAYCAKAIKLALMLKPDVVYASDPMGAAPGRLAARFAKAKLLYHEHDSPALGLLHPWISRQRFLAAQKAYLVIVPNEARSEIVRSALNIPKSKMRVVWNVPRLCELPKRMPGNHRPLMTYYHGNISPDLVPLSFVDALQKLEGKAYLKIIGYESPGSPGYIARLIQAGYITGGGSLVEYGGLIARSNLLQEAARAHVGIAFMPRSSGDLNMMNMTGASNKSFDYMAAGLALLVSDLPDWREMFVVPNYAHACDPEDAAAIADCLKWLHDHPSELEATSLRNRNKIEMDWNYDKQFAPILSDLVGA